MGFFDAVDLARQIRDADLFVLGGGGIFQDHQAGLAVENLFRYPSFNMAQYAQNILIAQQLGVPVVLLAQGLGPLRHDDARTLMREIYQAAQYVSLRDHSSEQLMQSLGVERDVMVAPDPIFSWSIDKEQLASDTADYRIGLVLREWPFEASWKSKVEACIDW
ncbi:polysaccharide pyruvyl transferase family protein, partial [Rhizobiaceae sp. 2RAB30]